MTKKHDNVDFLAGDEVAKAIRAAMRKAGRLPFTRDVVVTSVKLEIDNGIEPSAWAPDYPAEYKRLKVESVVWVIELREFLKPAAGKRRKP